MVPSFLDSLLADHVLVKQEYEGFILYQVRDPKGQGRIVIKRIIADSPPKEEVVVESIFHQLISRGYSFSCRSDYIFKLVDQVVVTSYQLSLAYSLPHLIEKEQSFSIAEASFAVAWQVLAAEIFTAKQDPFLMLGEATTSAAYKEGDCKFTILKEASSSAFAIHFLDGSFDAKEKVAK